MEALEERLYDLEAQLHAVEKPTASQTPLGSAEPLRVATSPISGSPEVPMKPGPQAGWVTVESKRNAAKAKPPVHYRHVHVSIRLSPLYICLYVYKQKSSME